MGKKAAALACLFLVSLSLFALEVSSGLRASEYASYTCLSGFSSVSIVKERTVSVLLGNGSRVSVGIGISSEESESVLNLDTFVSAGDFNGFSAFFCVLSDFGGCLLAVGGGPEVVFPHSWSSGFLVAVGARVCASHTLVLTEGLKLTAGIPLAFVSGPSFLSFRAGLYLEVSWQY